MPDQQHTVQVGVDVGVTGQTTLDELIRSLNRLRVANGQRGNETDTSARDIQQFTRLTRVLNSYNAALGAAGATNVRVQAQQTSAQAQLARTSLQYEKATAAARTFAQAQAAAAQASQTKQQAVQVRADASLTTANVEAAKAAQAVAKQQATAQNELAAATLKSQTAVATASRNNALAQSAVARSAQEVLTAQLKADAELTRANLAYQKAALAAQNFANQQARIGQNKGIIGFLSSPQIREAGESIQQAGQAITQFISGPLIGLGRESARSAIEIDSSVNVLSALAGGAAAAERRFQALFALAQKTPGLTTQIAVALDAQLKIARVGEQTINRFLVTVGRLNAIQSVGDPQEFANNLRQLIDQGFEKADLKQVVNRNAIAGELIKQIFSVDNPTNSEAIKASAQKLGIDTAEKFFQAFAQAGENNARLKAATESLAIQLEKAQDRVQVALRPVGLAILNALIPAIEAAVPVVEKLASAFDALPAPIKASILAVGLLGAALGPTLTLFGGLIQAFQVFQVTKIIQAAAAAGQLGTAAQAATGGVSIFTASLTGLRAALVSTSAFLFTTPAGWAILAGAALVAAAAYIAFNNSQEKVIETADKLNLADITDQLQKVQILRDQATEANKLTGQQSNLNNEQAKFNELLGDLQPVQRAAVQTLDDYGDKVETLKRKLQESLQAEQAIAQARAVALGPAIAERQRQIELQEEIIKRLDEEKKKRTELLNAGQVKQQTKVIDSGSGEILEITENLADAERDLSQRFLDAKTELDKLNGAQAENIVKLRQNSAVLQQNEDALLANFKAGRLTEEQYNLLKNALDRARASAPGVKQGADSVSDSLSNMEKQARAAKAALDTLFTTGDAGELRKQIDKQVNEIAARAAKPGGGGATAAVKEISQALKENRGEIATSVKALNTIEAAQKAIQDRISPKAKGGGGGGTRSVARDVIADLKARDDLLKAQLERELQLQRDTNQRLLAANQSAFDQNLKSFRDFIERRRQLQEAGAELDIRAAKAQLTRLTDELGRILEAQAKTKDKSQQQQLAKEEDRIRGEIVTAEGAVTLAQRRRADVGIQASRDLQKALADEVVRLREIETRYLEITDRGREAARISIAANAKKDSDSLKRELASVEAAIEKTKATGDQADLAALESQRSRLTAAIAQTAEIERQQQLNADFAQQQRELADIEAKRILDLDALARQQAAVGEREDVSTRQRRDLMAEYQKQIDQVIESLEKLKAQGARNPEIDKAIQDLKNKAKNEGAVSLEDQIQPFKLNIAALTADRDRALEENDRKVQTVLSREMERVRIAQEFNDKLREQLGLWEQIEQRRSGGVGQDFKAAQAQVQGTPEKVKDFSVALKDAAASGAINAITGFFTDVASGAKSFGEAAADALGAFLRTIQQIIIQILVLKLIEAVTGIPVGALLKISAGGAASGGAVASLASGGSVAHAGNFAAGGGIQSNPTGYVRGPGGPRSDSILAWFPAAGRFANISNTEYVLDAETTRNVGIETLDRLRASKGRRVWGSFADGGALDGISAVGNSILSDAPQLQSGDTNVALNQTIQLSPVGMVRQALRDRSVVRDILEVIGGERTKVSATLTS